MLKTIETRYAGCHFRSRLEARWAVFFNNLGVRWDYELQGFHLPAGPYLPDFWLPEINSGIWFEVKPDTPDCLAERNTGKWDQLVEMTKKSLVIAHGMPRPDQDLIYGAMNINGWMEEYGFFRDEDGVPSTWWDNGRAFCECPECGKISIQFEGRSARIGCHPDGSDRRHTYDSLRILDAYRMALSARFEHGQSGA